MGNLQNLVENTKDFLGDNTPMFRDLDNMPKRPEDQELMTHMRMLYGHVDWESLIVEVDPIFIKLLNNAKGLFINDQEVLKTMQIGDHVALLNAETKGPLAYSDFMSDLADIEILNKKSAVSQAAYFFVFDLFDSGFGFKRFAPYFLIAFRLALLEGVMADEERFSTERVEQVWKKTFSLVMASTIQHLIDQTTDVDKGYLYIPFNPYESIISDYLENVEL